MNYVRSIHFRIETLKVIIPLLRKGIWAATVDLKDIYLHILMYEGHQRFLTFNNASQDFHE